MLFRARRLETNHGTIETPALFPVRNIGVRSSDNTPEYTASIPDISTAMVNARAIRTRTPQWERITNGRGLRQEMGSSPDTVVFADSGGYTFRDREVDTTPAETLETQRILEADIFGTLDLPISRDDRSTVNQKRIRRSIEFAIETSRLHRGDGLLFASVHGYDPKTIRNSINYLERKGGFDGFALGSLVPIRTDYRKVIRLVLAARLATDKHLHVYGLGGFLYQLLLAYLGVDSFDSSSFIHSGGKRRYLIPGLRGDKVRNFAELTHPPCACPVCADTPLDEVRSDRGLLTKHNLWAISIELRRLRYMATIGEDLEHYLDLRYVGNPVTKRAFAIAKQQVRRLI